MMRAPLPTSRQRPRVALFAHTPRNREYGRRALRLLGGVPLVFLNADEFLAMGDRTRELAMVLLEHSDEAAEANEPAGTLADRIRREIGDDLPMLHSIPAASGGSIPGFRNNDMLLPASLSFAQLCRTLKGFMQLHSLPARDARLEWGAHRFCVESGTVFVDGVQVQMKPEEFDLALELFFNAGTRVSRPWLRAMVPAMQTLRRRPTGPAADVAVLRVRDMLGLEPAYGWELEVSPGLSCQLTRLER